MRIASDCLSKAKNLFIFLFLSINVTSASLAQTFETSVEQISTQIVEQLRADNNTAIAVGLFTHRDGSCSDLSDLLYDEIVFSLFSQDSGLRIIERAELGQLFGELRLQRTGAISTETIQEIGNMTGAESLLIGSISDFGEIVRLNARVLDTDTAQVTSVARTNFSLTETYERMIAGRSISKCGFATTTETNTGSETSFVSGQMTSRELIKDQVLYRLSHISLGDREEINGLTFEIENQTDQSIFFTFQRPNYEIMYISDTAGSIRVLEYNNRNDFSVFGANVCFHENVTRCDANTYTEVLPSSISRVVFHFPTTPIKTIGPILIRVHFAVIIDDEPQTVAIDFRDVLLK